LKPVFSSDYFVISLLLVVVISALFVAKSKPYVPQPTVARPITLLTSSHNSNSATNNSFLRFLNQPTLGISIEYPFNWKGIEADDKALIFLPPSKKDGFPEKLIVAVFGINSSVSAGQLSSAAINKYGEQYTDFFIINSKPISFKSDPAYSLSYSYTDPGVGTIGAMDIGIKHHNKVYVISYSAEQPEYHTYIPAIEKMIASFRMN